MHAVTKASCIRDPLPHNKAPHAQQLRVVNSSVGQESWSRSAMHFWSRISMKPGSRSFEGLSGNGGPMCWRVGAGWRSVPGQADLSVGLPECAHSMAACDPSARSGQRSLEVTHQHSPCAGSEGPGGPWEPASFFPEGESGLHREAMRGLNHSGTR